MRTTVILNRAKNLLKLFYEILRYAQDDRLIPFTLLVFFLTSCGRDIKPPHRPADDQSQTIAAAEENSKQLGITIIDVGQGDSSLVEFPSGETLLIDTGPEGAGFVSIIPLLASKGITSLDSIIITHYHADHMGSLAEILSGPDGKNKTDDDIIIKGGIYDRGDESADQKDPAFQIYKTLAAPFRRSVHPGDVIQFGGCGVEVVAANGITADGREIDLGEPPDENAAGVAFVVECLPADAQVAGRGFRMFFGGDLTGGGGNPPYETPDVETFLGPIVGDIAVLKVSHHGSNTSTNESFLDATTPEIAIISVGDGNDYFHPHQSVTERLLNHGIEIYQTERGWQRNDGVHISNGDVFIEVDPEGKYLVRTTGK